jgi:hypothetical protein
MAGAPVGRLGTNGVLYLGARVASRRWGYRDPRSLLGGSTPAPPVGLAPPPRTRFQRWPRTPFAGPPASPAAGAPAPARAPLLAWLGLAVAGVGAGLGTTLRLRRRRAQPTLITHATDGP